MEARLPKRLEPERPALMTPEALEDEGDRGVLARG